MSCINAKILSGGGCLKANIGLVGEHLKASVGLIGGRLKANIGVVCSINSNVTSAIFKVADGDFILSDGKSFIVLTRG